MVEMNKLLSINFEEVEIARKIVADLEQFAEEAKSISKLIYETYKCFGVGEASVQIFVDPKTKNVHYLKHCGVWFVKNAETEKEYAMNLAPTIIYDYYRCEYKLSFINSQHKEYQSCITAAETLKHFREFIDYTIKKNTELKKENK